MNIFYDVVAPEIRTPRDVNRLLNALAVTWPAIGPEVDRADFVGLETLRLLRPVTYRTLRSNKERLCGEDNLSIARPVPKEEYDRIFLRTTDTDEQERLRHVLMRLFPPLERIWNNVFYSTDAPAKWSRQRRACSSAHFDAYFRFSLGEEALSRNEIDDLLSHAGEADHVEAVFKKAVGVVRSNGVTKAALILDELSLHADNVAEKDVAPLLKSLFKLADALDIASDVGKGFSIASNGLRLHWLLRRLTLERFELPKRSSLFMNACKEAALGWLVDFADSAYRDYHPRDGSEAEAESKCLTTSTDADALRAMALVRLREASKTQELAQNSDLASLLYRWREFADDGGEEVRRWTQGQLENDAMIVRFAHVLTSHSWSQGMGFGGLGDRVARRSIRAGVQGLETIMNKERFRARVEALAGSTTLQSAELETVRIFLEAWQRHDKSPRE
jgi:predicted KAP-like P-loop ATPase